MEHSNYNTTKKKYTHLKYYERYKLEVLLEQKIPIKHIYKQLDKHISTIYREIHIGTIKRLQSYLTEKEQYRSDFSHNHYKEKLRNKGRVLKINEDAELKHYIEIRIINDCYSPDAIIGEIKQNNIPFNITISTKILYRYIDTGVFDNISNKNLLEKSSQKKSSYKKVRRISFNNRSGKSIEQRPLYINNRSEYGQWLFYNIKSFILTFKGHTKRLLKYNTCQIIGEFPWITE